MSVPTSAPPTEPSFDVAYSFGEYEDSLHRDNTYLTQRLEQVMLSEGAAGHGRTLDVACGVAISWRAPFFGARRPRSRLTGSHRVITFTRET